MWSLISLLGPVMAIVSMFAIGWLIGEERVAVRAILAVWLVLGALVALATYCAFRRKERARWITLVAALAMLVIIFGGVSFG